MYASTVPVIALFASTALVSAVPALHIRQSGVTCQTSSASPHLADITLAINQIKGRGGLCRQSNPYASGE